MESFSKSLQLVHIVDTLGYNFYIKPCTIHHISENIDDINYTIYIKARKPTHL